MDPLTEFFYQTFMVFYIVGMVTSFTFIPIFILFWKRWMPLPARTLFWAARRGTPPLLLVHDSGRGELTTITERKGEGIVVTREGKYKILPRVLPLAPLEKKIAEQIQQGEQLQDETVAPQPLPAPEPAKPSSIMERVVFEMKRLKEKFVLDYSDWIVKRCMLVGLRLPFFVGYTGKLCLLNPEALALYEMGDLLVRTEDETLFNPHKLEGKSETDAMQPLLLMDPRKIQQIIYNGFDQSQIAGVVADSEELAKLGKGFLSGKWGILIILVIVLVLGLGLFLLPQFLPPAQAMLIG